MIRTGLACDVNGEWHIGQLALELQEIIRLSFCRSSCCNSCIGNWNKRLELVICIENVEFHIFIVKFGCGVKFVPTYYIVLPYKLPSLFVFIYIVPNK